MGYVTSSSTRSGGDRLNWLFRVAIHFRTYIDVASTMDV